MTVADVNERQLLIEHVQRPIRRHGPLTVGLNGRCWTIRPHDAPCPTCRRPRALALCALLYAPGECPRCVCGAAAEAPSQGCDVAATSGRAVA